MSEGEEFHTMDVCMNPGLPLFSFDVAAGSLKWRLWREANIQFSRRWRWRSTHWLWSKGAFFSGRGSVPTGM